MLYYKKHERPVKSSKARKKRAVAARIESYQRGYSLGFSSGYQNVKTVKKVKVVRKRRSGSASKKHSVSAKLDSYHRGYQLGVGVGAQQEARQVAQKASKPTRQKKRGASKGKLLAAARLEAYLHGMHRGAQQVRNKSIREKPNKNLRSVKKLNRVLKGRKVVKSSVKKTRACIVAVEAASEEPKPSSRTLRASPASVSSRVTFSWNSAKPMRHELKPSNPEQAAAARAALLDSFAGADLDLEHFRACDKTSFVKKARAPRRARAKVFVEGIQTSPTAILEAPTPVRTPVQAICSAAAETVTRRRIVGKQNPELQVCKVVQPAWPPPCGPEQIAAAKALQAFLADPSGVTREQAAYQLRCEQLRPPLAGPSSCQAAGASKMVVIIVSGKCTMWKLNQIIAACFGANQHDFVHEPKQGTTVLGSHFVVTRPLPRGQCDKGIICSSWSASDIGFVDDQGCSVAQVFRGKSTGSALQREPADVAQRVAFASSMLNGNVALSLDGIMLDSYDSHNPFDKKRRTSNGQKPLPRIVSSSFMDIESVEAKNFTLQGYREGHSVKFDASWPSIHRHYRLSQRTPLFHQDGRDFQPNDIYCVGKAAETNYPVADRDSAVESTKRTLNCGKMKLLEKRVCFTAGILEAMQEDPAKASCQLFAKLSAVVKHTNSWMRADHPAAEIDDKTAWLNKITQEVVAGLSQ